MARDPLKPRVPSPRHPTDNSQMHNGVLQAPRMMQIGGATSLHAAGGPHKSKLTIRKPGGTK